MVNHMKTSVLFLAAGILLLLSSGCITTGQGEVTDTVHSMEYSGILCKTHKVWVSKEVPTDENDRAYSIHSSKTAEIALLKEAQANGKPVHIKYHTDAFTFGCFDELHSGYAVIDSVTYAGEYTTQTTVPQQTTTTMTKESYISCGCGCCGFDKPLEEVTKVECLNKLAGERIEDKMAKDANLSAEYCATAGCSLPVKYMYCD
jgi:hypothetical protein